MTTRERILAEATSQLLERGYSAFTMSSVQHALELSSGSMFHAFPSKPALVAEIYVDGMTGYHAISIAAMDSTTDAVGAVQAWVEAHLTWVRDHRSLARFLFATQPDEVISAASPALSQANERFFASVEALVERAVAAGFMARLPVGIGHSVLMGSVQEYCRQWTRGTMIADPDDVVDLYQRVAVAAMTATLSEERVHV